MLLQNEMVPVDCDQIKSNGISQPAALLRVVVKAI